MKPIMWLINIELLYSQELPLKHINDDSFYFMEDLKKNFGLVVGDEFGLEENSDAELNLAENLDIFLLEDISGMR